MQPLAAGTLSRDIAGLGCCSAPTLKPSAKRGWLVIVMRVVVSQDADAVQKLRDLRARYAEVKGRDYRGFETDGDRIFRLAEGWTTGGDELGWIHLTEDVILAFVGHEVYVGNEQLRWAVVAKCDSGESRRIYAEAQAVHRSKRTTRKRWRSESGVQRTTDRHPA